MSDWEDNILREPIARNTGAVLSLPTEGSHKHFKTRFLAEDIEGVWMEAPPGSEQKLVTDLIASGAPVAVAFKSSTTKFTFGSAIRNASEHFPIPDGTSVAAVLLSYPAEIRSVQLRAHMRVPVPPDNELAFRIWKMPHGTTLKDAPLGANEIICRIRDVSLGGLGISCPAVRGAPVALGERDRLRMLLAYRECSVLIEGVALHPRVEAEGQVLAGVQFTPDGNGIGDEGKVTRVKAIAVALHRAANPTGLADEGKVVL